MKIYIIEDDLIIAQNLKENLEELSYDVVGVASDFEEVKQSIFKVKPDLCLVDIYLKESTKNGIDIVKHLQDHIDIPFVYLTSFDDHEYRNKAKSTRPAAYLLKPASKQQLDVTIDMALSTHYRKVMHVGESADNCPFLQGDDLLFIKNKDRYEKFIQSEIIYLKASGTYTEIISNHKKILVSLNLKRILSQLNQRSFLRCHRSYAVNRNFIEAFDDSTLFLKINDKIVEVPISRGKKEEFQSLMPRMKGK